VCDGDLSIQFGGPRPLGVRFPRDNREVAASDAACSEGLSNALVCRWMDGEEHEPGGGGVEAMVQCRSVESVFHLREEVILAWLLCAL